jgi:hypothetical protein
MSQPFYSVNAYSKRANQLQREFNEQELKGQPITNKKLANQHAESFALRLNNSNFLGQQDWTPKVEVINNTNVKKL